uniref:Uncharacterized protein n=2 Tax=Panagrolaimus sp. ES5 TaxID=591445 RepID=A0AC34GEG6_9BILA
MAEDPTFFNGDDGDGRKTKNNKSFDPYFQTQQYHQLQEEQRHSNRDSGISSEKQKQQPQQLQQQQQPKINQHMSRFLSDTMKSQQSFDCQKTVNDDEENAANYLLNADGKVLIKQSQKFVVLADSWDRRKILKERQHQKEQHQQQKSPPISSLPPTSNMQEGARAEIIPTRFSDRLTPDIEILHDNDKRENRRPTKYQIDLPRNPYQDEAQPKYSHRSRKPSATRRNNFELNAKPLSRPHSQSSSRGSCCNSSNRCCHHTVVYQYNCPPDHHHLPQYDSHSGKYRARKPTMQNEDEKILQNLGILKAA